MSRNWHKQSTTCTPRHQRTALETIVSRPHHGTGEPAPWPRQTCTRKHSQARHTEPSIARSTARPAQPLHLPEIRCRYLRTVNKLPGVPTEPEWVPTWTCPWLKRLPVPYLAHSCPLSLSFLHATSWFITLYVSSLSIVFRIELLDTILTVP